MAGTGGWDTVLVVDAKVVDGRLATTMPASAASTYVTGTTTVTLKADLGAWTIATGGGGRSLRLAFPITNGALTTTAASGVSTMVPFAGRATVLVELTDSTTSSSTTTAKVTGSVKVIEMVAEGTLSVVNRSYVITGLERALNEQLPQLNTAFATVNLGLKVKDQPGFDWMAPVFWTYVVADRADGSGTVFGVLTMLEGGDGTAQAPEVDPGILPPGKDVAFLVSSERFLTHMILPATTTLLLPGADPLKDFAVDRALLRNTKEVPTQPMTLKGGKEVEPTIPAEGLRVEVVGDQMLVKITNMSFEFTPGVTANMVLSSTHQLSLDKDRRISLTPDALEQETTISQSAGVIAAEVIADVVIETVAIGLGVVIGGLGEDVVQVMEEELATTSTATAPVMSLGGAEADAATKGAALTTAASDVTAGAGRAVEGTGWFARVNPKVFWGVTGGLIGLLPTTLVAAIPVWLELDAENQTEDMPTIDNYLEHVMRIVSFGPATTFVPTEATFHDGLKIVGRFSS